MVALEFKLKASRNSSHELTKARMPAVNTPGAESGTTTRDRINDPLEDTQLAFYAALLHDDTLAAAYVNISEKETKTYAQTDVVQLRDDLVAGILDDMNRLAQGAPLPAMGEGKACEFCAARGLCRKDFWTKT